MIIAEAPKTTQKEYLQLDFIPSLQGDGVTSFEASLPRSNLVVQMSQQLPHLNFPIVEGPKSSYIYGLANKGAGLDLVNLDYRQLVAWSHPNLVLKFSCLKDLYDLNTFNISG